MVKIVFTKNFPEINISLQKVTTVLNKGHLKLMLDTKI